METKTTFQVGDKVEMAITTGSERGDSFYSWYKVEVIEVDTSLSNCAIYTVRRPDGRVYLREEYTLRDIQNRCLKCDRRLSTTGESVCLECLAENHMAIHYDENGSWL